MVNDRVLAKSPCFGCSKARWIEVYPDYNTIAIRVRVKVMVQLVSLLSNTHPLDSDLPGTQRYPTFEQPGPARYIT